MKLRIRSTIAGAGLALIWALLSAVAPAATPGTLPASNHWAFVAPRRNAPPDVKDKKWVRNSIDAFVLYRLEQERIKPSPEASRSTLIRRLSLDLLGLPPG